MSRRRSASSRSRHPRCTAAGRAPSRRALPGSATSPSSDSNRTPARAHRRLTARLRARDSSCPGVASPELVDEGAIVLGGCDLAEGVRVGPGSCLHGADAPAISVGRRTQIGRNSSLHELSLTSCRIGADCIIGDRVVLHGPLEVGDRVRVGNGAVLFGPKIAAGVTIGAGALVFGPVEVTSDVPDGAVIVPPGMEFLIAPSAVKNRGSLPISALMLVPWLALQQAGGSDCGLCALSLLS